MSKGQTLRALVNERLAAAAEDIVMLFVRTMAEYEEELRRCHEENRRKQQLLDQALSVRVEQVTGNAQAPPPRPNRDVPDTPRIKEEPEEQGVKLEEEQLPVCVPECSAVFVKTEQFLCLQQNEETPRQDVPSERPAELSSDTDNDDDWEGPDRPAPETPNGDASGADGADGRKHQCPFCQTGFRRKSNLERHVTVHTGQRPYSCGVCQKRFAHQSYLDKHSRTHTGEKPYTCSECQKTFARKTNLTAHRRRHTGEKPYGCSICKKTFAFKSALGYHRKTHTGEKPYSCTFCDKSFVLKSNLDFHKNTNTHKRRLSAARSGTKPYNPPLEPFTQRGLEPGAAL